MKDLSDAARVFVLLEYSSFLMGTKIEPYCDRLFRIVWTFN